MKQVLQSMKSGTTEVADVPPPSGAPGALVVQTTRTLISVGTERMLVEFGKANLVEKARKQPDKVRMVLDKVKTDGLAPTLASVRNKLDQPLPLGYCNVGYVTEVGKLVTGFAKGDRVVSNGKHAEVVSVPVNLCAGIPDAVSDEEAAFTVIGAIALQGIRLAQPTLGEAVVVTGLGLIGLITVQLLRANGCRVLGVDYDAGKLAMAREFGAETVDLGAGQDPVAAAQRFSRGRGVDAVLITAATKSSEPMHQAAIMCRQRGRIILVGVAGLELSRDDFYKKELSFQVSSSYGPGRYDPSYEEQGHDYPVGFVRWTEQRNFEAVLDMMSDGRLDVKPLISHRFAIEDAAEAYAVVSGAEPSLGILLEYPAISAPDRKVVIRTPEPVRAGDKPTVTFIGAGNYATAVLIPAFKTAGAVLGTVVSSAGVSGLHAARKYGFGATSTDTDSAIADPESSCVVVTTRHDSHARLVLQGLRAGKHVFVEKPLALQLEDLDDIEAETRALAARGDGRVLMVGFNRRFAPHIARMKGLLRGASGPKAMIMTVNAGALPPDHWTLDRAIGGGRVIGEACHFIDLLRFLADAPITTHSKLAMDSPTGDTVSVQLGFADGSIGTIHYFANGSKTYPKERLDVFVDGRVLRMDNYRKLTGFGWPGFKSLNLWQQDKGQRQCAAAFVRSVETGSASPIPFDEIMEVSRVSVEVASG